MDHSKVCDCQFRARCTTYNDSLIDARRKGPDGLGCENQTDEYRGYHCKAFQCSYLTMVVTDGFRHLAAEDPQPASVRANC
ncbi:MAG: hypothetical protein ACYTFO_09710 [Planctomycetota bacterium]|jgi:hypothetical protein